MKRKPPRIMTSDGEIITGKSHVLNAPEGALIKTPVSAGIVEGISVKTIVRRNHPHGSLIRNNIGIMQYTGSKNGAGLRYNTSLLRKSISSSSLAQLLRQRPTLCSCIARQLLMLLFPDYQSAI